MTLTKNNKKMTSNKIKPTKNLKLLVKEQEVILKFKITLKNLLNLQ